MSQSREQLLGSSSSAMVQAAVLGPRVLGPEVETENRDKRNVTKLTLGVGVGEQIKEAVTHPQRGCSSLRSDKPSVWWFLGGSPISRSHRIFHSSWHSP